MLVDFLVDIEWSNMSATLYEKAFIFFENSPKPSRPNFAHDIGILFRLLLFRPLLQYFPSNSCVYIFFHLFMSS